MRFDPASGKTTVFREPSGKANGLMMDRKGNLIACEGAHGGGRRVSLTTLQGKTRTVVDRWQGKRFNSPNDTGHRCEEPHLLYGPPLRRRR